MTMTANELVTARNRALYIHFDDAMSVKILSPSRSIYASATVKVDGTVYNVSFAMGTGKVPVTQITDVVAAAYDL